MEEDAESGLETFIQVNRGASPVTFLSVESIRESSRLASADHTCFDGFGLELLSFHLHRLCGLTGT